MTTIQTLTDQFRTAQRNIGLGARRKVAIADHLQVRAALKLAQPLVDRGLADVLIGSYPRRTGIWPGKDVDVLGKLTNESIDTIEPCEAYGLFFTVLDLPRTRPATGPVGQGRVPAIHPACHHLHPRSGSTPRS